MCCLPILEHEHHIKFGSYFLRSPHSPSACNTYVQKSCEKSWPTVFLSSDADRVQYIFMKFINCFINIIKGFVKQKYLKVLVRETYIIISYWKSFVINSQEKMEKIVTMRRYIYLFLHSNLYNIFQYFNINLNNNILVINFSLFETFPSI